MENEKKEIKKRKHNKLVAISNCVSLGIIITIGTTLLVSKKITDKRFENVNKDLFRKTIFNVPAVLPVKNGKVNLNIRDCFSQDEVDEIVEAIEDLDIEAKGIDFGVSFEDKDIKKSINIKSYDYIKNDDIRMETLGYTDFFVNNYTAKIVYPINLYINTEDIEFYGADFNTVVRHELLHCFGFADLYADKYEDNIMYYGESGYYKPLAEEELEALNTVYTPKRTGLVQVEKPTKIIYKRDNENLELEELETENK